MTIPASCGTRPSFLKALRHPLCYLHGNDHTEHNALLNQSWDGHHSLGPLSCNSTKEVTPLVSYLCLVLCFYGVGAFNHPSNGLKGNFSGSLRFMCVASPRAKSYYNIWHVFPRKEHVCEVTWAFSSNVALYTVYNATRAHNHSPTA